MLQKKTKVAGSAHFEVSNFALFLAKKTTKTSKFGHFKCFFHTHIEDKVLTIPNLIHAHAFHKKIAIIFIESALVQF